jgi:hypothetical protein
METLKEYYKKPYYFYIKEGKNDLSLYFSVSETLTEARKKDEVLKFDKKNKKDVENEVKKIIKDKKIKKTSDLKKHFSKKKTEIEELVDYDGSMLSSKIPIYNPKLSPNGTMDQEIAATRQTNNPVIRGYRVYWGEGKETDGETITEIDFSDAFGYEETKDLGYEKTVDTLEKMGVDNAEERADSFGKDKKLEKKKKKGAFIRQRLTEKDKIEEAEKKIMSKMVEDIVLNKKNKSKEINKKEEKPTTKLIMKNLESLKKLAEKEGINLSDLIQNLKK